MQTGLLVFPQRRASNFCLLGFHMIRCSHGCWALKLLLESSQWQLNARETVHVFFFQRPHRLKTRHSLQCGKQRLDVVSAHASPMRRSISERPTLPPRVARNECNAIFGANHGWVYHHVVSQIPAPGCRLWLTVRDHRRQRLPVSTRLAMQQPLEERAGTRTRRGLRVDARTYRSVARPVMRDAVSWVARPSIFVASLSSAARQRFTSPKDLIPCRVLSLPCCPSAYSLL